MKKFFIPKDDLLGNLIRKCETDTLSEGFEERLMEQIRLLPVPLQEKRPFYLYLGAFLPFVALIIFVLFILFTSDLPFLDGFPGKNYLFGALMPFLDQLMSGFRIVFSSSFFLFGLMIGISAGLLFLIERIISRTSFFHRHTMAGK